MVMHLDFCRYKARLVSMLLVSPFTMVAQQKQTGWKLNHVVCHEVGAVLTFDGLIEAEGATWTTILGDLPSDVAVANAQIELPQGMQLIAVNKVVGESRLAAEVAGLQTQVEARRLALDLERALLMGLDQERAFLEENRDIGGSEILLVDDVEEMRAYIALQHESLSLRRVDLMANIRGLEKALVQAESDLESLTRRASNPSHSLELVVTGTGKGQARVSVATQLAGWVSSYDMSWNEESRQLGIGRFARLVQTTGLDWENVRLELRTGKPLGFSGQRDVKPKLMSRNDVSSGGYCANVQWVNSGLQDAAARQLVLQGQGAMASNWSMGSGKRVSISGGGDVARIWLDEHVVEASAHWEARPNTSESAIRTCSTRAWMELHMLSGESRMFHDNTMVGVLPLNMPAWGDSLHVELGFDNLVRATTKLATDQSGTRKMSGKRVVQQQRLVQVYNDGKGVATVDVVEELPSGEGWEIEVTASNGGTWDAASGEITWLGVQVPASGSWDAVVNVRITLPKNASIVGL